MGFPGSSLLVTELLVLWEQWPSTVALEHMIVITVEHLLNRSGEI